MAVKGKSADRVGCARETRRGKSAGDTRALTLVIAALPHTIAKSGFLLQNQPKRFPFTNKVNYGGLEKLKPLKAYNKKEKVEISCRNS